MAQSKKTEKSEPMSVAEIRAAGHHGVADKLAALHDLQGELDPHTPERHRPLTDEELVTQRENALNRGELEAAQRVEYGTYRATEDIFDGTALAYAAGQPVPVSNVERHGYQELGLVERVDGADRTAEATDRASDARTNIAGGASKES